MSTPPPCAGKWALFDSTDPRDHYEARALCATCPLFAACLERLRLARSESHVPDKYGPAGTWAGRLVGPRHRIEASRAKAEEGMFTEQELRTLHADYAAGFRSPRTVMAERVYNRRNKRAQLAKRRAA